MKNIESLSLDALKKRQAKKRLFILLIVVLTIFALTAYIAFAEDCTCNAVAGSHEKGAVYPCTKGWGLKGLLYKMYCFVYSDSMYNDLLVFDLSKDSISGLVWDVVKHVYEPISAIGYLLVIVYFIMGIIDNASKEMFGAEQLFKLIIKLFIAVLVITNGLAILEAGIKLGNSLVSNISSGSNDAIVFRRLWDECKQYSWLDSLEVIGEILNLLLEFVLSLIPVIIILLTIFSRYIEIAVRSMFAPIGMADLYESGPHSNGIKYLKKLLAVFCQGAIIAGVLLIKVTLSASLEVEFYTIPLLQGLGIGTETIINLVAAMAILKSRTWANDLFGVTGG